MSRRLSSVFPRQRELKLSGAVSGEGSVPTAVGIQKEFKRPSFSLHGAESDVAQCSTHYIL